MLLFMMSSAEPVFTIVSAEDSMSLTILHDSRLTMQDKAFVRHRCLSLPYKTIARHSEYVLFPRKAAISAVTVTT